jgi:hypothetical protein
MRPVQLVGGDAIRSSAFIARHRRRCQRRQLSLGATLPGVSEAIRIFGVRFFDQFTLTVAKPYIAFVAAGGDAPIKETFNRFAEQNFDRQPGCDGLQINCATD